MVSYRGIFERTSQSGGGPLVLTSMISDGVNPRIPAISTPPS